MFNTACAVVAEPAKESRMREFVVVLAIFNMVSIKVAGFGKSNNLFPNRVFKFLEPSAFVPNVSNQDLVLNFIVYSLSILRFTSFSLIESRLS